MPVAIADQTGGAAGAALAIDRMVGGDRRNSGRGIFDPFGIGFHPRERVVAQWAEAKTPAPPAQVDDVIVVGHEALLIAGAVAEGGEQVGRAHSELQSLMR